MDVFTIPPCWCWTASILGEVQDLLNTGSALGPECTWGSSCVLSTWAEELSRDWAPQEVAAELPKGRTEWPYSLLIGAEFLSPGRKGGQNQGTIKNAKLRDQESGKWLRTEAMKGPLSAILWCILWYGNRLFLSRGKLRMDVSTMTCPRGWAHGNIDLVSCPSPQRDHNPTPPLVKFRGWTQSFLAPWLLQMS